jgi:hypothetical protein
MNTIEGKKKKGGKKQATRRHHKQKPQKRMNSDTLIGYLGQTDLRKGQCDRFVQSIKLWSHKNPLLGKHIPNAVNNRTSVA